MCDASEKIHILLILYTNIRIYTLYNYQFIVYVMNVSADMIY